MREEAGDRKRGRGEVEGGGASPGCGAPLGLLSLMSGAEVVSLTEV